MPILWTYLFRLLLDQSRWLQSSILESSLKSLGVETWSRLLSPMQGLVIACALLFVLIFVHSIMNLFFCPIFMHAGE